MKSEERMPCVEQKISGQNFWELMNATKQANDVCVQEKVKPTLWKGTKQVGVRSVYDVN